MCSAGFLDWAYTDGLYLKGQGELASSSNANAEQVSQPRTVWLLDTLAGVPQPACGARLRDLSSKEVSMARSIIVSGSKGR